MILEKNSDDDENKKKLNPDDEDPVDPVGDNPPDDDDDDEGGDDTASSDDDDETSDSEDENENENQHNEKIKNVDVTKPLSLKEMLKNESLKKIKSHQPQKQERSPLQQIFDYLIHGKTGADIKSGHIKTKATIGEQLLMALGFSGVKKDLMIKKQAKNYWLKKNVFNKEDFSLLNTNKIDQKIEKQEKKQEQEKMPIKKVPILTQSSILHNLKQAQKPLVEVKKIDIKTAKPPVLEKPVEIKKQEQIIQKTDDKTPPKPIVPQQTEQVKKQEKANTDIHIIASVKGAEITTKKQPETISVDNQSTMMDKLKTVSNDEPKKSLDELMMQQNQLKNDIAQNASAGDKIRQEMSQQSENANRQINHSMTDKLSTVANETPEITPIQNTQQRN